ncbi:DUF6093 family protein [Streptomyces venezuelae]|uniref:DUF6093 family protein n=1 Tax=Streptomyces venezuelae TaxID=54571 RepID=UPI00345479B1
MALDLSGIKETVENLIPWDTVRITTPAAGEPVFGPVTGLYTYPEGDLVYEGDGAVQLAGTVGGVTSLPAPNLPWVDETRSKYKLLTPLRAPLAERDMLVTVVTVHPGGDLALLDRQWRVQDPAVASTMTVIRMTTLDQVQQTREVP